MTVGEQPSSALAERLARRLTGWPAISGQRLAERLVRRGERVATGPLALAHELLRRFGLAGHGPSPEALPLAPIVVAARHVTHIAPGGPPPQRVPAPEAAVAEPLAVAPGVAVRRQPAAVLRFAERPLPSLQQPTAPAAVRTVPAAATGAQELRGPAAPAAAGGGAPSAGGRATAAGLVQRRAAVASTGAAQGAVPVRVRPRPVPAGRGGLPAPLVSRPGGDGVAVPSAGPALVAIARPAPPGERRLTIVPALPPARPPARGTSEAVLVPPPLAERGGSRGARSPAAEATPFASPGRTAAGPELVLATPAAAPAVEPGRQPLPSGTFGPDAPGAAVAAPELPTVERGGRAAAPDPRRVAEQVYELIVLRLGDERARRGW